MIDYTLRRSDRARHTRLTIRPDGEVVVTLPKRAPERWASDLVQVPGRVDRPSPGQDELPPVTAWPHDRASAPGARSASAGSNTAVHVVSLGDGLRRSRVVHDDADGPRIRLEIAPDEVRALSPSSRHGCRAEARDVIMRRVTVRARDLGVQPTSVAIRDQRSRWGSASRRGTLSFSWRLVMTPATVLDYVVVHELAHLRHFGHGPAFWKIVHGVVPEADAARRWLRSHETENPRRPRLSDRSVAVRRCRIVRLRMTQRLRAWAAPGTGIRGWRAPRSARSRSPGPRRRWRPNRGSRHRAHERPR